MKRSILGDFEFAVLSSIARLGDGAYGMSIRQDLEHRSGRKVSIGAVYTTLQRLEAKHYISSQRADPTPERGGRAKRFFKVQQAGLTAMDHKLSLMKQALGEVLQ